MGEKSGEIGEIIMRSSILSLAIDKASQKLIMVSIGKGGDVVINFSKGEREVMEILWRENRELTAAEITDLSTSRRALKSNSVYLYINGLLKKGAIKVTGHVPAVRTHARTYKASVTEADYILIQVTGQISARANPENLKQIILTAIKAGSISEYALDELQDLIDKQREELRK